MTRVGYYDRMGRVRHLKLKFTEDKITPESAQKWARHWALQWGDVNHQKKVRADLPGHAWWFGCSGHGGYILVAPMSAVPKLFNDKFAVDGAATWSDYYYTSVKGYAVYRFEEDCNWAVLEYAIPEVAYWAVLNREREFARYDKDPERKALALKRLKSPKLFKQAVAERLDRAWQSILRWQSQGVIDELQRLAGPERQAAGGGM
ncbi:hypothetical protein IT084_15755 [Desulfallas sp. Bu1-1]|uniref:hypothetical protein n=1 Tax=Desulfallas sp. Bu1-1 TaxID=2787620 RepID=UPI0018A0CAD4|nr:hypothetical protein [Desulfallas sp. Bu1-1]MBF7084408.1 hypothetical protein [Desulfallas sp. Bu1-1]